MSDSALLRNTIEISAKHALDEWAQSQLDRASGRELKRGLELYEEQTLVNVSSNDYLGLSRHPTILEAVSQPERVGAASSRLISGNFPIHLQLEQKIAAFCGYPSALVFGAGYLANIGVLTGLVRRNDVVVSDRLIHASLVDGIGISRARHFRYAHNDLRDLETRLLQATAAKRSDGRLFLVTESVFSMHGDLAPLEEIAELALHFQAVLIVDEAHALGVLGPGGRGCVAHYGLEDRVAVVTGSFGKAFGSYGGVALCSTAVRSLLVNQARSFVYNTGLPPVLAKASLASLEVVEGDGALGATLLDLAASFREKLTKAGLDCGASQSQIVPVRAPGNRRVNRFAAALRSEGVLAVAIRAPSVPVGEECVRVSLSLLHDAATIDEVADKVIRAAQASGVL